jgi:hypothetical protein
MACRRVLYCAAIDCDRTRESYRQISDPRWVHAIQGWNWLVYVRFVDRGRRRSYALLFNGSNIVDSNYAYQTEQMRGLGSPPLH